MNQNINIINHGYGFSQPILKNIKKTYIQCLTTVMSMMTIILMNFMKKMTKHSFQVLKVFFAFTY